MLHELLERLKLGSGGDVVASAVQLSNLIMFDVVSLDVIPVLDGERVGPWSQNNAVVRQKTDSYPKTSPNTWERVTDLGQWMWSNYIVNDSLSLNIQLLLPRLSKAILNAYLFTNTLTCKPAQCLSTFGCFALTNEERAPGVAVGEQLPLCILSAQFTKVPTGAGK